VPGVVPGAPGLAVDRQRLRARGPAPAAVDPDVARDAEAERRKALLGAVARSVAVQLEERLLDHLFGLLDGRAQASEEAQEVPGAALDQVLEGSRIPVAEGLEGVQR
jgi:hypothetical protein